MTSTLRRALVGAGAVIVLVTSLPAGVAGQTTDSTAARIRARLERLGRAPGADSVLFVRDSLRREVEQQRTSNRPASDSTLAALLRMPGFALTEYEAGAADFSALDRRLVLQAGEGNRARVNREGMVVEADTTITFDEGSGRLTATGAPTFTPQNGETIQSEYLVYDINLDRGSASAARSTYNQAGTQWNVRGDMPYASPDSSFMSHAIFTSCDIEEPHYHFETDEIKIVAGNVLVARPVRLYFADVPVLWLPFIAQSLSEGRSSGLLTPSFSVNDIVRNSTGYRRRISNIGFYWAMSDYSDATIAIDWFSGNFLALESSLRYQFNRQFLSGGINFRRYWRENGATELSLNTRNRWEMDERTQLSISGSFASSADFVRQNSFDPREVTQSIDSQGGLNRRFGWGSLSLTASRRQYLSDDRVEWTAPSANISLSTITLFRAPSNRERFYNNMTWGGSASFNRRTLDRQRPETFDISQASTENRTGSLSSSLSLGSLSLSQSVRFEDRATKGIPEAFLLLGDSAAPEDLLADAPSRAVANQNVSWQVGLNYQQQLIGSTTLTPSLSLSGELFQSDTSALASSFVSAPRRMSLGVSLKTDLYRIFPGFGSYEAIRHKFSPTFDYRWSPSVSPTELQADVFGTRAIRATKTLAVSLNQTFEAKRRVEEAASDSSDVSETEAPPANGQVGEEAGPRRLQTAPIVQLLGIRTSVVNYDFVEADSVGTFLSGFSTTRLSNQITSDFLAGLSLSINHDLWEDTREDGKLVERKFAPHLSQVNMSFALNSRSSIFRLFGLLGGDSADDEPPEEEEEDPLEADPFQDPTGTESSIVPGPDARRPTTTRDRSSRNSGWRANLTYSLQRPRLEGQRESQMLNGSVTLRPTEMWDLSWRTSYDLSAGQFNDHAIRLTRDLHRWEAHFDFLQTATGNWQFRFEVALTDNRDLKFDYRQRNLDAGTR